MNPELVLSKNINIDIINRNNIFVSIENERNNFSKQISECLNSYNISYENPNKINGDLSGGNYTFTISPINSHNKFSERFYDCTGIVCSGISKEFGEKISFLSHQDSIKILGESNYDFVNAINLRLNEMIELVHIDSIDIGIFGGSIQYYDIYLSCYAEVIKLLRKIVKKLLSRNIEILIGPNLQNDKESIKKFNINYSDFYFDNDLLVLHSYKPPQKIFLTNLSFPSQEAYDYLSFMK